MREAVAGGAAFSSRKKVPAGRRANREYVPYADHYPAASAVLDRPLRDWLPGRRTGLTPPAVLIMVFICN
jgi:hypothetical protein